jgi:acetoin utilization deacetylase AcuC-like enzyme
VQIFYTDQFVLPLPVGHRFPMLKYRLLREAVQILAPQLLTEPPAATDAELGLAHTNDYIQRVSLGKLSAAEQRAIGFPWSPLMVERSRRATGATCAAAAHALAGGRCGVNLAGGTHHAYADHGEGFCVFNDSVVAARLMQQRLGIERVLIIDCDVHQGDGTAAILADDPSIFTFSIHAALNYPFVKRHSDLDIALPDGCDDQQYLAQLEEHLPKLIRQHKPQLAIYLAGADPFEGDRLGRLSLTQAGLLARDCLVMDQCQLANIPLVVTMAGGYAHDIEAIVDCHLNTVKAALERFNV